MIDFLINLPEFWFYLLLGALFFIGGILAFVVVGFVEALLKEHPVLENIFVGLLSFALCVLFVWIISLV